jgi:hypothetical protein
MSYRNGDVVTASNILSCTVSDFETNFDNLTYLIFLKNDAGDTIKECTGHQAVLRHTGKFTCKDGALSAVLTIAPA